jgi:hypothetical protein
MVPFQPFLLDQVKSNPILLHFVVDELHRIPITKTSLWLLLSRLPWILLHQPHYHLLSISMAPSSRLEKPKLFVLLMAARILLFLADIADLFRALSHSGRCYFTFFVLLLPTGSTLQLLVVPMATTLSSAFPTSPSNPTPPAVLLYPTNLRSFHLSHDFLITFPKQPSSQSSSHPSVFDLLSPQLQISG